ncbi:MAG: MMPL family transporter [Actinomycetota bacterium]|nr:MMPL family transporter [Actinomycetota bacterium]
MHRQIAGKLTGRLTKWLVLAFWILVLVGASGFAAKLTGVQDNQASSWLPGNAESTQALKRLEAFQSPNVIPTVIVYENKAGLTAQNVADGKADARAFTGLKGVTGKVIGPIPSKDGQAMQTLVTFDFGKNGWNSLPAATDKIRAIADGHSMSLHVAGLGGQAADSSRAFAGIDGTLLFATIGVVIVILLFTYRSPILWLLPVFSALVALFTAQGVIYLLAKYAHLTVNGQSSGILTVLVFGAGTDYALLLVARYREELRRHDDRHEAMAFALHRASPAIIASAGTVVLGMLCLLLAEMNSTAGLGPVLAVGIGIALLVMTTLLPALLVILGRWIFWPARPGFGSAEPTSVGIWARIGNAISGRARVVWVGTSVLLAIACLGIFRLDAHGLSTADSYTKQFDSVVGQKVLARHGLADNSSPLLILANADKAQAVAQSVDGINGLGTPSPPLTKGNTALIAVPLLKDASAPASFDAVRNARSAAHQVAGADALVGGQTGVLLDVETASSRDNRVIIPVVLVVVLLILMLLLRSVVGPLLLIATVVLSFGAALGLSSLLFHYVFGFAGADASFPLFVFVFLVALGIDYNIFLMTRVREETAKHGTRKGSLIALAATGGVITSAGLVLASTFLVLGSIPLVFLAELGVAVALGVMLDTLVVRSVLVTALNLDLGSRIWWPSRLDRATSPSTSGSETVGEPTPAPEPVG